MKKLLLSVMAALAIIICLVGCSTKKAEKQTVLIYSCSEDEVNADLKAALDKQFPDYEIVIQYLGTGAVYTKLLAEGNETDADIIFDLEGCYASALLKQNENIFADLSNYDFSAFKDEIVSYTSEHKKFVPECKTDVVVAYSKSVLENAGVPVPTTYEELLDEKYKGLISMSSPKSSGTGYTFYNTLVSDMGLENALDYFDKLSVNVKEITSSGSAPLKSVNRGEAGIAFVMLWQTIEYMNNNPDIGYTFLDKGTGYNVYTFEMIGGKEKNKAVKDVFDFMFNTWNLQHCQKFYPDAIYKNQGAAGIANYPTNVPERNMQGIYDYEYKQRLLDAWKL